jgi:HEAT repeat protein
MSARSRSFLPVLTLTLTLTACVGLGITRGGSDSGVPTGAPAVLAAQDDSRPLRQWLSSLRSPDDKERAAAKEALVAAAGKPGPARQYVVGELLKLVAVGDWREEFLRSPNRYREWKEAVDIVGTIRAAEALDTLVACLECNNGMSGLGPGRFPAVMAVVKFGDEAVPRLAQALRQKTPTTRFRVAQALYVIASDSSREALSAALRETKDRQFAAELRELLRNWKGPNREAHANPRPGS